MDKLLKINSDNLLMCFLNFQLHIDIFLWKKENMLKLSFRKSSIFCAAFSIIWVSNLKLPPFSKKFMLSTIVNRIILLTMIWRRPKHILSFLSPYLTIIDSVKLFFLHIKKNAIYFINQNPGHALRFLHLII